MSDTENYTLCVLVYTDVLCVDFRAGLCSGRGGGGGDVRGGDVQWGSQPTKQILERVVARYYLREKRGGSGYILFKLYL